METFEFGRCLIRIFYICFHYNYIKGNLYKQDSCIVVEPFIYLIEVLRNIDLNKELKTLINNKILEIKQLQLYCCPRKLGKTLRRKVQIHFSHIKFSKKPEIRIDL